MSSDQTPPIRPPRRDAELRRAAILAATRAALAESGYARTTIRDIAQRAGVTHGLVMRHFASKEQLLVAALSGTRGLDELIPGDPASLPERLASGFITRMEANAASDRARTRLARLARFVVRWSDD